MDRRLFHVRPVHGLVAKLLLRCLELVAHAASLFCPGGAHHVLHRLVNAPSRAQPCFPPSLVDTLPE
jgi:hypothetical protein